MKRRTAKWWAVALSVALLAVPVAVAPAAAQTKANLYEVTENVGVVSGVRVSTSQLSGSVQLGNLLCPAEGFLTNLKAKTCTVNVVGTSEVSLGTGVGPVYGRFAVVVQDPNNVDAPEYAVQAGSFTGTIDMTPVLNPLAPAPLAFITNGSFTVEESPYIPQIVGATQAFTATFRLPFALNGKNERVQAKPGGSAFYLGDGGTPVPVAANERSLGSPTVRVDVTFTQ